MTEKCEMLSSNLRQVCEDQSGCSLLWHYLLMEDEKMVERLIESGADVNDKLYHLKLDRLFSFLQVLPLLKDWETKKKVAKILIHHGANATVSDRIDGYDEGRSPLRIACITHNLECAEFFLESGARLDCTMKNEVFYIFRDVCGSPIVKDILLLLLKYGIGDSYKADCGENLLNCFLKLQLVMGVKVNLVEVTEILLNSGALKIDEEINAFGLSTLAATITMMNIDNIELFGDNHFIFYFMELISYLIEKGADVRQLCFDSKYYPIHLAVKHHCPTDVISILLSNGAHIDDLDFKGRTALHLATAEMDDPKNMISFLINNGANVNIEDSLGRPPVFELIHKIQNQNCYVSELNDYNQCLKIMVKHISKLEYENLSVSRTNIELILKDPTAREHHENCNSELEKMSVTLLCPGLTYYAALINSKNIKLIRFMKNSKKNFKGSEENSFDYYSEDLQRNFREAKIFGKKLESLEAKVTSAFFDVFPYVVVRKIAENLLFTEEWLF